MLWDFFIFVVETNSRQFTLNIGASARVVLMTSQAAMPQGRNWRTKWWRRILLLVEVMWWRGWGIRDVIYVTLRLAKHHEDETCINHEHQDDLIDVSLTTATTATCIRRLNWRHRNWIWFRVFSFSWGL